MCDHSISIFKNKSIVFFVLKKHSEKRSVKVLDFKVLKFVWHFNKIYNIAFILINCFISHEAVYLWEIQDLYSVPQLAFMSIVYLFVNRGLPYSNCVLAFDAYAFCHNIAMQQTPCIHIYIGSCTNDAHDITSAIHCEQLFPARSQRTTW